MAGQDGSDLLGFVSSIGGGGDGLRVEESLGEGYVRLRVSEAERRQAKHDIRCIEDVVIELLRNARDAGARRIFVSNAREGDVRTVTVLDDGCGIPPDMWGRVFDARVTTKLDTMRMDRWGVHGRGMALFSIRENAERAEVRYSGVGLGTSIQVVTNVGHLAERADQSTWPEVRTSGDGHLELGAGPHNVVRSCCEFALLEPGCHVYVGSAAETIAAIRGRIPADDPALRAAAPQDSVFGLLAHASGPRDLTRAGDRLGLSISERTAQRIASGEIAGPRDVVCRLNSLAEGNDKPTARPQGRLPQRHGALRMSNDDVQELSEVVSRDVQAITSRYYTRINGEPVVRVRGNKLTLTFNLTSED